jgi:hypothetical protein
MSSLRDKLVSIRKKIAQENPDIAENIDGLLNDQSLNTNNMVHTDMNPKIETFAKPRANVSVVNDSGTIHSFAVEIKASKDGPIPDTQLMSKILEAIENQSNIGTDDMTSEFSSGMPKFEVVSFKYERRDDKKNTK